MRVLLVMLIILCVCSFIDKKNRDSTVYIVASESITVPDNISIEIERGEMIHCPSGHTLYLTSGADWIETPSGETIEYQKYLHEKGI